MNRFTTIGAMAVFGAMAAGCNSPTPAAKVQQDVAKDITQRSDNVAQARRDGAKEVAAQQRDVDVAKTNRDYQVALAKVEGDYKTSKDACNVLSGDAQSECRTRADAVLKADKAKAELLKTE